jgi:hypothetical protein
MNTTLNTVRGSLAAVDLESTVDEVSGTVDVAVGHAEAFIILPVNANGRGLYYEVSWARWDRTGGMADEKWLADVRLEQLGAVVLSLLAEEEARVNKLEAEMAEAAEWQ